MATFNGQIAATADDGYTYPGTFTVSAYAVGYDGDYNHAFARFLNVTIPKGATITSAKIQYKARASTTPINTQSSIYANKVVAPTSPTSEATYAAKALTTAFVNWDSMSAWTASNWYDSPDISTVIQEIVNQTSWISGNALMIMHKNRRASGPTGYLEMNGYENGAANAPKLVITYSTSVSGSFAITNSNSVSIVSKKSGSTTIQIANSNSIVVEGMNPAVSFKITNSNSVLAAGKKGAKVQTALSDATNASAIGKKKALSSVNIVDNSIVLVARERIGGELSTYLKVYDAAETAFTGNGLCVLNDCMAATITEELNGVYEVEIQYPLDERGKWLNLIEDNIIKADGQLFRIYYKKKTLKSINIKARHIFYDLLDNFLEDVRPTMLNGAGALDWMLTHTQYPHSFKSVSDVPNADTWYFVRKNPVQAIMGTDGIIARIGGEIERDNFTINLHNARGADRGVLIAYGKNILGIEETLDTSGIVTRLLPVGKDNLMLSPKYVDSPYVNNYPHPKVATQEFSDKENVTDLAIAANDYILNSKCDIPQFNYKVDFIELTKTEEYKRYMILETVYMADTVTIKHSKLNIDLKAKVIKITKNLITGRVEKIELGSFKPNLSNIGKELQTFKNDLINIQSAFQIAVDNATKLITGGDGGNFIIKQDANGKPIGLLIMDTMDANTALNVWQFNLGGLGHSSTGVNGPYTTAITADGSIVATFITSGILNASLLKTGSIISQDGSLSLSLVNGAFTIGGGTGDIATHTDTYSKWKHGINDYTMAQASGLIRHSGTLNKDYHYLMDTGEKLTSDANRVLVTVDPAFKGKQFVVTVAVMDTENPVPYNGETMVGYTAYVDESTYDYANGTVYVYGWGTWYDARNLIGDQILGISRAENYYSYISGLRLTWTAIG